jgi:hypothetical protein
MFEAPFAGIPDQELWEPEAALRPRLSEQLALLSGVEVPQPLRLLRGINLPLCSSALFLLTLPSLTWMTF